MTALKAIDAVLRRDETKDYGSRGKIILISGGYGIGKSMLAQRMLEKFEFLVSKHEESILSLDPFLFLMLQRLKVTDSFL